MDNVMVSRHWMQQVLQRAGVDGFENLALTPGLPVADVWRQTEETCDITGLELARHVAAHFRLQQADLGSAETRVLKLVPQELAHRFRVFPLREDDRHLVVATSDPTDLDAEKALGFASGRTPVFEVASPTDLEREIEAGYSPDRVLEALVSSVDSDVIDAVRILDETEPEALGADAVESGPVVKLTNLILRDAIAHRASDIHLEAGRGAGTVRFRVDGVLFKYMGIPMAALNRVVSRIKILGRLDIADRLRPQDGRARVQIRDGTYDLRISTVPTRDAEKAVIRVLDPQSSLDLEALGLASDAVKRTRDLLGHRDGIIIVTGPTGSGKTTTLYAALRELATGQINIMTVEDPVEYELPEVTQIQVEERRGVTFASALRAILRQDPDVIFVGEIRDLETAEVAVQASMTGHLVLATLHTNDALSAIQRLMDLGLDRPSIAVSLRGVVAQRLVRRLCERCARPATAAPVPQEEARLVDVYGVEPVAVAMGCRACGQTGYRGRLAVAEVAVIEERLQQLIAAGAPSADLTRAARAAGMQTLRDAALAQVRAGSTTLAELERSLGKMPDRSTRRGPTEPHILLVDDDAVNRTLAKALLTKHGFRVSEAGDGAVALERLGNSEDYDLMVLDLDMPKVGGSEVLGRVRSTLATAALPVVVLTGTNDPDAEIRLMENGADDYIRKPIDSPRFVARIRAALRRAGAGVAAD